MTTSARYNALVAARRGPSARAEGRRAYAAFFAEHDRRVMACERCERAAPWRGWLAALLAGWAWSWERGRVVFLCTEPACRAPREAA